MMTVWGMTMEEYSTMLNDSFISIRKATRRENAQHYAKTRILADNLERTLNKVHKMGMAVGVE